MVSSEAGAIGDLNGDGTTDVVLGGSNTVSIFLGGSKSRRADVTLEAERLNTKFGSVLALVDLNHDGYDDLVVGAPEFDVDVTSGPIIGTAPDAGKVYVWAQLLVGGQ